MQVGRVSLDTGDRNMLLMTSVITVAFLVASSVMVLYQGVSVLSATIAIIPLAVSGVLSCVSDRRWVVLAVCGLISVVAAIVIPESIPLVLGVTIGLEGVSYLSHLIVMVLFPSVGSSSGRSGRMLRWILCIEHLGQDAAVSFRAVTASIRDSIPGLLMMVSIPLMSSWILVESFDPRFHGSGSFIGLVVCIALYSLPLGLVYCMLVKSGMGVVDGPRIHNVAEGVFRTSKHTALILGVMAIASVLLTSNGVSVLDTVLAAAIMVAIVVMGLFVYSNQYGQAFIDTIADSEEFSFGSDEGASSRYDDLPGTPTRDDGPDRGGRQRYL